MTEPLVSENVPERGGSLVGEALQRGTRLGRYELLVPIAVGGMARVWAARLQGQRGFTKLVAVKTILPHLASDRQFESMLVDEARIASGVRHPNVCEIHELGDERGVLYVAMEWVDGDSLSHVIKGQEDAPPRASRPDREPLDPRIAARIVADAAAGLHAAHNLTDDHGQPLEVVHRDVSPQNILVSIDGNVKVTDFGVAKALNSSHEATVAGQLKGKIAYMAPEQATGATVDRRSDVFSLGVVLYEATTGKQPFRGEAEHAVLQELVKGVFAPPSRVVRGFPFELERILTRAMAQQPSHRFPTMDQFRLSLEEWLARSGPVVTQSHVAAVVRERIGAETDKRRERIRAASSVVSDRVERDSLPDAAQMTPSGVVPHGAGPGARGSSPPAPLTLSGASASAPLPPVLSLAPRAPSLTEYAIAAAVGVLAALAIGAAGFFLWRSFTAAPPVVAAPAAPATAAPAVAPEPRPSASAAVPAARPASPVLFKVVPDQAHLIVDGADLGDGVRTIPHPAAGKSVSVVVHASGFRDEKLTVDDSAPASVDVWLEPVRKSEARAPAPQGGKAPEPLLPNPY